MSASLVGSEMCIRDRANASNEAGRQAGKQASTHADGPARPTRRSAHAPVSYTHLTLPTICSV
eukprot:9655652-Alexandrium_andersonii.AAC.1